MTTVLPPIAPDALSWRFTRAGGPGGQHVNTSSTRVELECDLALAGFSAALTDRLVAKLGPVVRVVVADTYKEAEVLNHPKFGVGFVSEVIGHDKIEVTFQSEKRVLAHNRQGMSLPPAAYAHVVDATQQVAAEKKGKGKVKAKAEVPAPAPAAPEKAEKKPARGKAAEVEAAAPPKGEKAKMAEKKPA